MKIAVKTIEGDSAGEIDLADAVSALPVRKDILAAFACVCASVTTRQQGTHKTKGRAEVDGHGEEDVLKKGTGEARHGNQASPTFRGGGKAYGPTCAATPRPDQEVSRAGARARCRPR